MSGKDFFCALDFELNICLCLLYVVNAHLVGCLWSPSEYEDSDQLRSMDEESEDAEEVDQPDRLSRKKNVERVMITFDPLTKRKDIDFCVRMMFSGPREFREAIRGYCLGKGKDVRYIKNTGKSFSSSVKTQNVIGSCL